MKKTFPCFLCQTPLEIKTTKKGKPVLTCMTDGVQAFVRYPEGIRRLEELTENKAYSLAVFVVFRSCDVAVKRGLQNIEVPLFRRAGIYCPKCEELLLEAPEGWRKKLRE